MTPPWWTSRQRTRFKSILFERTRQASLTHKISLQNLQKRTAAKVQVSKNVKRWNNPWHSVIAVVIMISTLQMMMARTRISQSLPSIASKIYQLNRLMFFQPSWIENNITLWRAWGPIFASFAWLPSPSQTRCKDASCLKWLSTPPLIQRSKKTLIITLCLTSRISQLKTSATSLVIQRPLFMHSWCFLQDQLPICWIERLYC